MIKKIIKLLLGTKNHNARIVAQEKANSLLRTEKKSDIGRWENATELFTDWNERTAILGNYILPNSDIIEFGAGNMFLKTFLSNYKSYTPSDIIKRSDETIVCDLNTEINIDFSKYQVAVFSGVLEYVYDINRVFEIISKDINQVVISYCCTDLVQLSREKNGWLSDYTKSDLEEIFTRHGFKIANYTEWRKQSLFNLIRNNQ